MNTPARWHESHLTFKEFSLEPGGEWQPSLPGWALARIGSGTGYWLEVQSSTALEAGTVLLVAEGVAGCVRASQLKKLSLHCSNVIPARLNGLFTLGEQDFLQRAVSRRELALQIFPPRDPVSERMAEICAPTNGNGLLLRLNLLRLLAEIFGNGLAQAVAGQKADQSDAKERLRKYLGKTPPDALLEISLNDLARATGCTTRHMSRIFYDLVGMSFRDKRAEIRLARARELLATSQANMVDVALESGYNSLSVFNLMFRRRFGISPGRWRQTNGVNGTSVIRPNNRAKRLVF